MEQDKTAPSTQQTMGGSKISLVIGGILIVVIIIFGWWYWSSMRGMDAMHEQMMQETTAAVPGTPEEVAASESATLEVATALSTQGTSDDLGSIEADLKATNLDTLGDPAQL